jgi:metacaspase-1
MAKGLSLNIGVNHLSNGFYQTLGKLRSPENDARAMAAIAMMEGYEPPMVLLTEQATKSNFLSHLDTCIKQLEAGDTFLLSFSGHGKQVEDTNNDEVDGKDEAWCFYDSYLTDDEIACKWKIFEKGVKIIVVSASCHSGTAIKDNDFDFFEAKSFVNQAPITNLSSSVKSSELMHHEDDSEIKAHIIHLSACEDHQCASAGHYFSHFTDLLLKFWDYGRTKDNYQEIMTKINKASDYHQKPKFRTVGANASFLKSKLPFKLN